MLIDTRTKESMIASLAAYLDITEDELFQYIEYAANKAPADRWAFNTDIFEEELLSLFSDLQPEEQIDEIYIYHLTRRLNGSIEDKSSDNLKSLLLKESAISTFLRQYGIAFIEKDGHLVIVFNDNEISLEDTFESDVCYLRSRLGYNSGREDYCFNGFALRDQLMRNSYTRQLYGGPEFLDVLSRYLSIDGLKEKYCENSKYYCFTYKMTIDEIMFDDRDDLGNDEKIDYLLVQIAMRIMSYMENGKYQYDHDNPIIRIADDACVPESKIVNIEEIKLEMIK